MASFSDVKPAEKMEGMLIREAYAKDTSDKKVELVMKAFRDDNGKPWEFPAVRKAEALLINDKNRNHDYIPILGSPEFLEATNLLLLGKDSKALQEKRVLGVQTLGGAGGFAIGARFLQKHLKARHYYYAVPTWDGLSLIFQNSGYEAGFIYRYWDDGTRGLDIEGMLEDLSKAEANSVVVLPVSGHNATGCDPTTEQWERIASLMKKKKLFPFLDSAQQGVANGHFDEDVNIVRYFVDQGFELLCAQSFAKNFGLYGERVGNLTFIVKDPGSIPAVQSQARIIVRSLYTCPSSHGSSIVTTILNNPALRKEWEENVHTVYDRIRRMRTGLRERLEKLGTPGSWHHLTTQVGMSSLIGLTDAQVEYMRSKHHVYVRKGGRALIGGLTPHDLDHVANSIHDAVLNAKN